MTTEPDLMTTEPDLGVSVHDRLRRTGGTGGGRNSAMVRSSPQNLAGDVVPAAPRSTCR